jgi:hypothetical protein
LTILRAFLLGRVLLGVLLKDLRRYRRALNGNATAYLALCNRNERLEAAPDGSGYRCGWQWTSELHAPKYLPHLGLKLLWRALVEHPILRLKRPPRRAASPDVTFILGHRGAERLPHLLATLESIAGQQGAEIECIVVEQDDPARLSPHLPDWVRHIHTPPPSPVMPYCRAWTFNVGVRLARGTVLVLHDNDMLVPRDYASCALSRVRQGYEALNLKRFVFYLNEAHSRNVFAGSEDLTARAPEAIVQNLEAGGSVAITRDAYDRIGGFDESFVGWGGEDNEFWERAQTLKLWPYGFLPLVHLWHPPQPGRYQPDNPTLVQQRQLSAIPVAERIARLRSFAQGAMTGPRTRDEGGKLRAGG